MMLAERAAELIAAGRYVAPAQHYALLTPDADPRKTPHHPADFEHPRAEHINLFLGAQRSGRNLYMLDLDSHHAGQDAERARAEFVTARPELASKIDWRRTPRGWHGFFESHKILPTGKIHDPSGRHVGELLGKDSDRALDPGGQLRPGVLSATEAERLAEYWSCSDAGNDTNRKERQAEGASLAHGWFTVPATRAVLRRFLRNECGPTGRELDALFDSRERFDRSAKAGDLMQCLMFNAHKLAGWNASYRDKCRTVLAYWMLSDSYGKAADKDYKQLPDGQALIAKIIHEDPKQDGTRWRAPFWAKSRPAQLASTEAEAQPETSPEAPRRPAHRPAGDQARQLTKLRKRLTDWQLESAERISYYIGDLAEYLNVSRRTAQNYLRILEANGEIERGQAGGPGGRAWLVLLPAFWGAINSEKPCKNALETAPFWGANTTAVQAIETPQTTKQHLQCIEITKIAAHHSPAARPPAQLDSEAPGQLGEIAAAEAPGAPAGAQPLGDLPLAARAELAPVLQDAPQLDLAAPASIAEVARLAFDLLHVDRETGERRRVTRKRLYAEIEARGWRRGWTDAQLDQAIAMERKRRQIAAIVADIRSMAPGTLRAQLRLMERLSDKSRAEGTNLYRYAEWAARELRAELVSRPADPGRKPRKTSEALPDPRAAGARYQAELFALVDQARATTPAPAPAPVAANLIAGLKKRLETARS